MWSHHYRSASLNHTTCKTLTSAGCCTAPYHMQNPGPQLPIAQPYHIQDPGPQLPVTQPPTTQNTETSLAPNFALPLAPVNCKSNELSSSEIDKTKIPVVLRKYSMLHTECMISNKLCVKLSCKALFSDAVLKRCTPRG